MSDLHRAVTDEIDAFRPDRTPPFAALVDRHRSRTRRRYGTGAAALSAIAVAGVVLVPSALSGGPDRLPSSANLDTADAPRVAVCLNFPTSSSCRQYLPAQEGNALLAALQQAPSADGIADPCATGHDGGSYTVWSDTDDDSVFVAQAPAPAQCTVVMVGDERRVYSSDLRAAILAGASLAEPDMDAAPTGYSLFYDDEAAYNEQEQPVQACLDLAGITDVTHDLPMPPVVNFTANGAEQSAAIRTCVSGLAGVALSESPQPPTESPQQNSIPD